MHLLNLSLGELMALMGTVSGLVVAIYLLNRARQRQVVATLHFWQTSDRPAQSSRRRKIQQPLSLILQLISLALLVLAIAQPRLGPRSSAARDHVLVLDTSSWMAARGSQGTLLETAKNSARKWLKSLPSTDRVMVVRADGFATPATGFESDRKSVEAAIEESQAGANALNLEHAIAFAAQSQRLHSSNAGEVVYAGAGRIAEQHAPVLPPVKLRVLPVEAAVENFGIRKIGLRKSTSEAGLWTVFVSLRNYGNTARNVPFLLKFGGAPVASRRILLMPGKDEETNFELRTQAHGWMEALLGIPDGLPEDNRVILELPARKPLKVEIYTANRRLLEPIFAANLDVEAVYRLPSEYRPDSDARIVILDGFKPSRPPKSGSIWIEPPPDASPIPVRMTAAKGKLARWKADHALGSGLRTREMELESTQVFAPAKDDITVAENESGPVVAARAKPVKVVVLGFHPARSRLQFELATPLLFANILRWMEPEVFRNSDVHAGAVGTVSAALLSETAVSEIQVRAEDGTSLPFTLQGKTLRFFSGLPGTVRVSTPAGEQIHSLTLPEVGEAVWTAPSGARRGIGAGVAETVARDVWRWLALLGALGLLAEWILFGRTRSAARAIERGGLRFAMRKAS